jgi:apolipoprotein N-acyltransferase
MNIIRAVEFDRYALRTTQDGISALIDPFGHKALVFPEKAFHFQDVDFAVKNNATLFYKLSYTWYVIVLVCYAVYLMRKRRKA